MKSTRRGFLKTVAHGVIGKALISSIPYSVFANTKELENGIELEKGYLVFNRETQKSVEALAETFIPGAKEIGIKIKFMEYISKDPGIAGYLDSGFWNLDTVSKQRFRKPYYKLDNKEDRNAVLKHVLAREKNFINLFKDIVIKLYYSDPTVWKKLSYNGPPQPRGFMDYTLPPK